MSLYWLGVAQAQAGEYEAARRTLRAALDRYRPETLYLQLAQVHLVLREPKEARALLEELMATVPPQGLELEARYGLAIADILEGTSSRPRGGSGKSWPWTRTTSGPTTNSGGGAAAVPLA